MHLAIRRPTLLVLAASLGCGGADSSPVDPPGPELEPPPRQPWAVDLSADRTTLDFLGDTLRVTAVVRDSTGAVVDTADVGWSALDPAVRVDDGGLVTARRRGLGRVVASAGGGADTVGVRVEQIPATLEARPPGPGLAPGTVVDVVAEVRDSGGAVAPDASVSWASLDPTVAEVDDRGRIFGRALGSASLVARLGELADTVEATVGRLSGSGDFRVWSDDGTVIAGTLDLPPGDGPFPVMVRVHGSGARTRRSGLFARSQIFPAGIGIVRYDKRGVGESGGFYSGVGVFNSPTMLPLLAADAAAWLEMLTWHDDVDPERIGLLGVSQGGWINVIAADLSPHARYMINVVGPTITVGQQIFYQNLTGSTGNGENQSGLSDRELFERVVAYEGEHGFDPAPLLRELDVPGLWVLATRDYLVPYGPNVDVLDAIVTETGADYSVITLENATHGTRDRDTGEFVPWWDVDDGGFDWLRDRGFLEGG